MTSEDFPFDPGRLLAAAKDARREAYAPYSQFTVGAALQDTSGRVHHGVNVENASYGLSLCAERSAVSSAVASGARSFLAIAIAGPREDEACMPCGACRQVLHEFSPNLVVVVAAAAGDGPRTIPLRELFPGAFDASALPSEHPRHE